MPISGPVVHGQLMAGYTEAQARLEKARSSINATKEKRDDLDDGRGDALVGLAEHYLPELTTDAIRTTWFEIRATVSQILLRKEGHRSQLREELDRYNLGREHEDSKLVALNEELDAALESQHESAKKVEDALQKDDQFVALSDRAAMAEAALERAEANLSEIEQDAARKIPAYDNSKLFRYLYDRGFGTAEYTKRGFTRRMDRSLAKYIGYVKAKQGYEFLKNTPEQMRKIIAQDRESFDTVMTELERRRDEVADKHGLPAKILAAEALDEKRKKQLIVLGDLREDTDRIEHELTELEDTRGPYYREAVTVFREMLERVDTGDLERRARKTPEITDDQIVAKLAGYETEIENLDESSRRRREELQDFQGYLDAMGRLIQRFRASKFDSARSQFTAELDIVEEIHRGRTERDAEELWDRVRRAQRWGPTAVEKITTVASHPLTQVLINAMAHAAGGAMEQHARRAGRRRSSGNIRRRRW